MDLVFWVMINSLLLVAVIFVLGIGFVWVSREIKEVKAEGITFSNNKEYKIFQDMKMAGGENV